MSLAHRMPGRVTDAEDAVRDVRLRRSRAGGSAVRDARAHLARIAPRCWAGR
ncbi:hypothetical protein ACFZCP_35040 [Streptomyces sp. NPDC007971]|uniref:hypothetical protein n=1 Tax=Streptomyces sp. NPDC007971 TaxID=3364799 RepID=UPI0036EDB809